MLVEIYKALVALVVLQGLVIVMLICLAIAYMSPGGFRDTFNQMNSEFATAETMLSQLNTSFYQFQDLMVQLKVEFERAVGVLVPNIYEMCYMFSLHDELGRCVMWNGTEVRPYTAGASVPISPFVVASTSQDGSPSRQDPRLHRSP